MLKTRALSALVLAPPALAAAWFGGLWFAALIALGAALICWEWQGMTTRAFTLSGRVAAVACAAGALLAVAWPELAVLVVLAGAIASLALTPRDGRRWALAGPIYGGIPAVALVWLRAETDHGRAVVFWLLLLVWATDIGAYAFGRLIGGPLLLPVVSPKKTWAGLLGGMLCAGLAGWGVAAGLGFGHPVALALSSAVLAVVAQAGDLLESWVKRRWGVKDSSGIIPGHGGVLDRVDGLLAAAAAVAVVVLLGGESLLGWR